MRQFSIIDIRGPWAHTGRDKRRADTGSSAAALDACRLADSALPANAASPCSFLSQPY